MENLSVGVSGLVTALDAAWSCRLPLWVWGSPGIGKSSIVRAWAQARGLEFRDERASQLDPVDLRGLYKIEKGRTRWYPPSWLPDRGQGLFFWDELGQAPRSVQAALLQSILDRKVGDYEWPPGWLQIAASNRESDRAGVSVITPLLGRFVHIFYSPNIDDWSQWALGTALEGAHLTPIGTRDELTGRAIRPEVIAFLKFRPALLNQWKPDGAIAQPTPRTWEFASRLYAAGVTSTAYGLAILGAAVGEGAAAEFLAFIKIYNDLPDIKEVLAHPDSLNINRAPDVLWAICSAVSVYAGPEHWPAVLRIAGKLIDNSIGAAAQNEFRPGAECAAFLVKTMLKKHKDLASTPQFAEWWKKYGKKIL